MKNLLVVLFAGMLAMSLTGCWDSDSDDSGMENKMEEASDSMGDAAQDVQDGAEDAAEEVQEAAEEMTEPEA